ncbi:MAG: hypothetical protein LBL47_00815 [Lactobacillus sp.]|jgi:hypothetical protein|nr:hypothetical protein [Lactobacillus sp.]
MAEILFELIKIGNSVKVTAIDPITGIEAAVVVPSNLPISQAKQQALKKLKYILSKK